MTNSLGFQSQAKIIQLWMNATDRVLFYPQSDIAEHWTRDKREQTEFSRHFLSAERSIYYPQGALRSLQLPMDWQGVGQLISPKITEQLSEVDCDKTAVLAVNVASSEKVTCYRGKLGDQTIKLAWLDEENIPAYLNIAGKMKRYEYTLTDHEPWQATHTDTVMRWKRFLTTDYADVADDAVDDPFLARAVAAGYVYAAGAHRH
ncbi:hypothetical protein L4C36_23015 [Photobacterium japonica]|uniref:hypothetical protein n=1 Tax=Photobacterium japonica TaxID=2910235 RepID=UPI003D0D3E7C